jgi:hypothetical protein
MTRSRRTFITAGATVLGTFLAGCGGDEGTPTPDESTDRQAQTPQLTLPGVQSQTPGGQTDTRSPSSTPTQSPTPTNQERLRQETRIIFDQIHWFATQYDSTLRAYRRRAKRVLEALSAVIDSGVVRDADIETLQSVTGSFETFADNQLWPHFRYLPFARRNNRYIRQIDQFRERGEMSRAVDRTGRMQRFYQQILRSTFTEWHFSNTPIYGPLYWQLSGDFEREVFMEGENDGNDFSGETGLVYRIYYPPESYDAKVRHRGDSGGDDDPFGDRETPDAVEFPIQGGQQDFITYDQLFADISVEEGRSRRVYITVNGDRGSGGDDEEPDTSDPIYVQEYSDAATASRAIQSVINTEGVRQHGTLDMGGQSWLNISGPNRTQRLFDERSETLYVNLLQGGPYLIAAFPSVEWWDRRGDQGGGDSDPSSQAWTELVQDCWLWYEDGGGR